MDEEVIILGKKSWLAYVKSFVLSFVFVMLGSLIVGILDVFIDFPISYEVFNNIIYPIVLLVFSAYKLWDTSSYILYYDTEGIWYFSGVLPWTKGVRGVRWRDLDNATCRIGAISWFTNSYDVRINHRYTKENEIYLSDMWKGNKIVEIINEEHNRLIINAEI